jgi:CheY-like chemotaxis protein
MSQVLFIEDNLEIRENISEILELGGYQVLTAENGEIGIAMALSHLPDVILCDIQMPIKTGYEVLATLRATQVVSSIPFIFVTASAEKKEIESAMRLGANGYICKPFEPTEMFDMLKDILKESTSINNQ